MTGGRAAPLREAVVDLGAIRANVRTLVRLAGTRSAMVVVKADGYGHGALPVARAALDGGADWLGTADVDEAIALREAGVDAPLLAWLHDVDPDFGPAVAAGVDLGLSTLAQIDAAAATGGAVVHLKLETGLGRNGLAPEEWRSAFARAAEHERAGRLRVRGLFSHLANTSLADDEAALAAFRAGAAAARDAALAPDLLHLASTAAAIRRPEWRFDMVRLGIGAYGLSPFDAPAPDLGLRPAMRVQSRVAAVRRVPAGAGVSYDSTWRAPAATTLALVPLGYAEGVPRAASNRAAVQLRGVRAPVRGRIAMDQFVVEVPDGGAAVGDPIVLFGAGDDGEPTADDWAAWAGTINYEIVTRLAGRTTRRYEG